MPTLRDVGPHQRQAATRRIEVQLAKRIRRSHERTRAVVRAVVYSAAAAAVAFFALQALRGAL